MVRIAKQIDFKRIEELKEKINDVMRENRWRRGSRKRPPTKPPASFARCPVCQRPVRDRHTAITYRETKIPAHFHCVIRELQQKEDLGTNEKICYLGQGSFGIVSFRSSASPVRFIIKKRIQYEDKNEASSLRESGP
jgi:hypothetical protein